MLTKGEKGLLFFMCGLFAVSLVLVVIWPDNFTRACSIVGALIVIITAAVIFGGKTMTALESIQKRRT